MKEQLKKVGALISKNSPTILTGFAVAGLITTSVMAVRVTPNALRLLELERDYRRKKQSPELNKRDIVKLTWKVYLPPVIMGGATIACIIGANSIGMRRNAALASVYSLTEATLKEYQGKVVETLGVTKEQKIRDEIAKDRIEANPVDETQIIFTGKGETLCYDSLSGRYFKSDIEKIRKAENKLNRDLLTDNFVSLNEVYEELGLPRIQLGDEMGWSLWIDEADSLVSMKFSSQLTTDGVPCLVLDYAVRPRFDYMDHV